MLNKLLSFDWFNINSIINNKDTFMITFFGFKWIDRNAVEDF